MSDLAKQNCVPCRGGVPALRGDALRALQARLGGDWQVIDEHHLTATFGFPDFARALEFVNSVGQLAEEQAHHPDLHLSWGRVRVDIWTHKIDGLTESDFVFAAKTQQLYG